MDASDTDIAAFEAFCVGRVSGITEVHQMNQNQATTQDNDNQEEQQEQEADNDDASEDELYAFLTSNHNQKKQEKQPPKTPPSSSRPLVTSINSCPNQWLRNDYLGPAFGGQCWQPIFSKRHSSA